VGTHGYISPEQMAHPDKVDFRADIYSLGVTLHHALAGRLPYVRRAPIAAPGTDEYAIARLPLIPGGPPGFATLLARMLEPDPRDRPGSYDELLDDMQSLAGRG
jgi:serine/threonine protein kinase